MNTTSIIAAVGPMTPMERAAGRYMRAPDHGDIDITQDLTGGADDANLGDVVPPNGGTDAAPALPEGVQPSHGQDARQANQQQPVNQQQQQQQQVSLRDQLSNAFKGDNGQPTNQQDAQTVQPQAPAPLTKDAEGKWRQADGTFASAEQIAAFEAAQNAQQQPAQNLQQQQQSVLTGLTPVEQQQFQSLPAELRQLVERTMEGLNTRGARYGEYDLLEQHLIGPRRQAWAAQGMNPVAAVNQLFALSDFASRAPGEFVMWFASQNNLDLDALLDARDAQQSSDPVVRQLEGTVQQLQGTLQQFQNGQVQQAQATRLAEVQAFAEEKNAAGAFKRPHLTQVMDGWTTQIAALRAANPNMPNAEVLQRAYDAACWADPTVRASMQKAAEDQRKAAEAARVQAAKVAGSSVNGAPAGDVSTIPNNSNLSLREELQQQFAAARAV